MLEELEIKEWLSLNAKLQTKKNALRAELASKGVLKKDGNNTYDRYKYFSEAQYKLLFTELFSKHKLELKFDELEYVTFEGSEKQANGRMPKIAFTLFDAETGFYETTTITGEGIDKGDKAGYKAYTGALKYYLADTFMVATDDDPEQDSPQNTMNHINKRQNPQPAPAPTAPIPQAPAPMPTYTEIPNPAEERITAAQIKTLSKTYQGDMMAKLLEHNHLARIEDMTRSKASELISALIERDKKKKAEQAEAKKEEPTPQAADEERPAFDPNYN